MSKRTLGFAHIALGAVMQIVTLGVDMIGAGIESKNWLDTTSGRGGSH
jgi:hypothetical protein